MNSILIALFGVCLGLTSAGCSRGRRDVLGQSQTTMEMPTELPIEMTTEMPLVLENATFPSEELFAVVYDDEFRFPRGCLETEDSPCSYTIKWHKDHEKVHFVWKAKLEKGQWTGIAWTKTVSLVEADALTLSLLPGDEKAFSAKQQQLAAATQTLPIGGQQTTAEPIKQQQHKQGGQQTTLSSAQFKQQQKKQGGQQTTAFPKQQQHKQGGQQTTIPASQFKQQQKKQQGGQQTTVSPLAIQQQRKQGGQQTTAAGPIVQQPRNKRQAGQQTTAVPVAQQHKQGGQQTTPLAETAAPIAQQQRKQGQQTTEAPIAQQRKQGQQTTAAPIAQQQRKQGQQTTAAPIAQQRKQGQQTTLGLVEPVFAEQTTVFPEEFTTVESVFVQQQKPKLFGHLADSIILADGSLIEKTNSSIFNVVASYDHLSGFVTAEFDRDLIGFDEWSMDLKAECPIWIFLPEPGTAVRLPNAEEQKPKAMYKMRLPEGVLFYAYNAKCQA